jgi:hypothetical protein
LIRCGACHIRMLLKSNRGIREEIDRISAYLKPLAVPGASCANRRCGSFGQSVDEFPDLYAGHGTPKGSAPPRPFWRPGRSTISATTPSPATSFARSWR